MFVESTLQVASNAGDMTMMDKPAMHQPEALPLYPQLRGTVVPSIQMKISNVGAEMTITKSAMHQVEPSQHCNLDIHIPVESTLPEVYIVGEETTTVK